MEATSHLTSEDLLRHETFVLALARSLLGDEASAQDIAQETWLSALRRPPRAGSLRAWLERVTHNHAVNLRRAERRRVERHERSARPEVEEQKPSAQERLELQHQVVSALLSLQEPYRGVVIAAYYEGLAPKEIARRRQVSPGTVRSQLSRALDQLRTRLDCEHGGERKSWALALGGLLERAESGVNAPIEGVSAGLAVWGWWATGAAAVALLVFAATQGWRLESEPVTPLALAAANSIEPAEEPSSAVAAIASFERTAVDVLRGEGAQVEGTTTPVGALNDLPALLTRARQIKRLLIERRLEVDPVVKQRYAWLEALPDSGVNKLLDRKMFGFDIDLPWMDGGGAFFSFTERGHDYQGRPQIGLEAGRFDSGFYGGASGAVVDLGPGHFRTLAARGIESVFGLEERERAASQVLRSADPLAASGDSIDYDALHQPLRELGVDMRAAVVNGDSYLVRAVASQQFDVLVALEVVAVGDRDCTLAWRVLETRRVPGLRPLRQPEVRSEDIPVAAPELEQLDEASLLRELGTLRAEAERLLLEERPIEVEQRFPGWLGHRDAGIVRLIDRSSPWTELPRMREGGCFYSFTQRSWSYDHHPDLKLEQGSWGGGFAGLKVGLVLDAGDVSLDDGVQLRVNPALSDAVRILTREGPRPGAEVDLRDVQTGWYRDWDALGLRRNPTSIEGHTYLVRSWQPGDHDLLATFQVVWRDDFGDLITWQLVRSWPPPQENLGERVDRLRQQR